MIRAFVSIIVLSFASVSFAAATCDQNLVLSCRAVFVDMADGAEVLEAQSNFADENWDEPSLANCASTVYIKNGDATLNIHATQDLATNIVSVKAVAVQKQGGGAKYSNYIGAEATTGMILNMGSLQLPAPMQQGNKVISTVYVGCVAK